MLQMYEWQEKARSIWNEQRRGVVSAVTGSGKTVFALTCFANLRSEIPSLRLLVLVPTIALLDQWIVALQLDLGLAEDQIASYSAEGRAAIPAIANVCVINTARNIAPQLTSAGTWMLIVDECHRAGSEFNYRALAGSYIATLGISATPRRQYDSGFEDRVVPFLGPLIFEYDYASARRDGVIAPFEIHNVRFDLLPSEKTKYERLTQRIARRYTTHRSPGREGDSELIRLLRARACVAIEASRRLPTAAAALKRYRGKAIVFHERIAAAERLSDLIDKYDRRATTYHSNLSAAARQNRLKLFRLSAYDTLVTCRALDEGLNVPDASVAVVAAATASGRQRIQRLGRVLRLSSADKRAVVVTLYATDVEARRLREEESRISDVATVRWYEARVEP